MTFLKCKHLYIFLYVIFKKYNIINKTKNNPDKFTLTKIYMILGKSYNKY